MNQPGETGVVSDMLIILQRCFLRALPLDQAEGRTLRILQVFAAFSVSADIVLKCTEVYLFLDVPTAGMFAVQLGTICVM